jgi:hypothetical protein
MRDTATNSYDEMPYGARVQPATHPDRLAVIGTLFGMKPAPPERCRVLELGCACGVNLIALARELPGSRFVGIDPEVIHAVASLAPDLIAQQQYMDFLTDRLFRSSLLCHAGVVLDRTIPPVRMTAFGVVGVAVPQSERPDVGSAHPTRSAAREKIMAFSGPRSARPRR